MAFLLVWCSIITLYSLKLFNIYSVKDSTLEVYLIGIISFFIGYIIVLPKYKLNTQYTYYDKGQPFKFRIIRILFWISFIVLSLKTIKAFQYWISPSTAVANLKSSIVENDALNIGIMGEIIFTYLAIPMVTCLMCISSMLLLKKNRTQEETKIIAMGFILLIPRYLSSGSKTSISLVLIMMFGYLLLFTRINLMNIIRQYKKIIQLGGATILLIIFIMSLSGKNDVLESLYFYCVGCIPCSDNALIKISQSPQTFGLLSLNGWLRLLIIIPSQMGIGISIKESLDLVYIYVQQFEQTIYVAPNHPYNAFISMFSYFYADGGYNGVIVFSIIFGIVCAIAQNRANKRPSLQSVGICLMLFYGIITSMVRFQFSMLPFAAGVFYVFLLFPKTSIYLLNKPN